MFEKVGLENLGHFCLKSLWWIMETNFGNQELDCQVPFDRNKTHKNTYRTSTDPDTGGGNR